jgi:hypothetical protein
MATFSPSVTGRRSCRRTRSTDPERSPQPGPAGRRRTYSCPFRQPPMGGQPLAILHTTVTPETAVPFGRKGSRLRPDRDRFRRPSHGGLSSVCPPTDRHLLINRLPELGQQRLSRCAPALGRERQHRDRFRGPRKLNRRSDRLERSSCAAVAASAVTSSSPARAADATRAAVLTASPRAVKSVTAPSGPVAPT